MVCRDFIDHYRQRGPNYGKKELPPLKIEYPGLNGFLSIKFSLSGGSKYKVLETRLRWRGRMRLEPCQIGSIRPRRQALGRRTLHLPRPWSHLEIQWFHSLSSCQIGWIWGYACDGGDVCDWSLAKSAAHVHDAKPEGDVHSILSNPYDLTCFIPSQTCGALGLG